MREKKGSRRRRFKLGNKHELWVIETKGVSRWEIHDKGGRKVKVVSEHPLLNLLVIPSNGWYIYRENGVGIILYSDKQDFSDPTICILLLYHEIGHLLNWHRFTRKQRKLDERCAWAFALREMRRLEDELEVTLLTLKRARDIRKKFHRWMERMY